MKRANATRPPLARIQRIHEMLIAGVRATARTLARELEASTRTIQRDLDFMRDQLGLPLEYLPKKHTLVYVRAVDAGRFGAFKGKEVF